MRIFKHRSFHQWAETEKLTDMALKKAIDEMNSGLYEAALGSGLYKKRIAAYGKGKSGSYRTLIAFKSEAKAFFVYGFAKNDRSDINAKEEKIYRLLAQELLNMSNDAIEKMIETNKLIEVK